MTHAEGAAVPSFCQVGEWGEPQVTAALKAFSPPLWLVQETDGWEGRYTHAARQFGTGRVLVKRRPLCNPIPAILTEATLWSPGCPGAPSVDRAGFTLRDEPASASWVLGFTTGSSGALLKHLQPGQLKPRMLVSYLQVTE